MRNYGPRPTFTSIAPGFSRESMPASIDLSVCGPPGSTLISTSSDGSSPGSSDAGTIAEA